MFRSRRYGAAWAWNSPVFCNAGLIAEDCLRYQPIRVYNYARPKCAAGGFLRAVVTSYRDRRASDLYPTIPPYL